MGVSAMSDNVHRLPTNQRALNRLHTKKLNEYRFQDPDPIAEELREAIRYATSKEGLGLSLAQIAASAICTYQTVAKYADGEGKRPYNSTADRIFRACGWGRVTIKGEFVSNGKTISAEKVMTTVGTILNDGSLTRDQIVAMLSKTFGKSK